MIMYGTLNTVLLYIKGNLPFYRNPWKKYKEGGFGREKKISQVLSRKLIDYFIHTNNIFTIWTHIFLHMQTQTIYLIMHFCKKKKRAKHASETDFFCWNLQFKNCKTKWWLMFFNKRNAQLSQNSLIA